MTPAVSFQQVSRHFGAVKAVDAVDLDIGEGEFFAMLGPSGSGKTTCLRLIAGFEQPTVGPHRDLRRDGRGRAALPAQRQHGLPGLRAVPAPERARQRRLRADGQGRRQGRARGARPRRRSTLVKLPRLRRRASPASCPAASASAWRSPARSSTSRKVLLLDEPLGALDLKLREQMQEELKALQQPLGITFVFVTHDQGEALSMADRVAVFNDGRIVQVGTPEDIYERPRTALRRRFRRLVQRAAAGFRPHALGGQRALGEPAAGGDPTSARPATARRASPAPSSTAQLSWAPSRRVAVDRRRHSARTPPCPPAEALPGRGRAGRARLRRATRCT